MQFDFSMTYSYWYQDEASLLYGHEILSFTAALYDKDKPGQPYLVVTNSKDTRMYYVIS